MSELQPKIEYTRDDRLLAAACYLFGFPTLFCILTAKRFTRFVGGHSTQAFLMWLMLLIYWLAIRIFFNLVWWFFGLIGVFFPYWGILAFLASFAGWIWAARFALRAWRRGRE